MGLPDFLIIGAMKSGSTWLHNILASHSEIEMAADRKEVHYFSRYYDRGIDWYKNRFIGSTDKLIGETTPSYLSGEKCPSRIADTLPAAKLICILRNPVDRAYSHYNFIKRDRNISTDLFSLNDKDPDILKNGLYFRYIKRYLNYFKPERIKIIILEEMLEDMEKTVREICDYLNISYNYDSDMLHQKANVSQEPRFHYLYVAAKKFVAFLYKRDWLFLINIFKRLGLGGLFFAAAKGDENKYPPMSPGMRAKLYNYYKTDIESLEILIQRDLSIWKTAKPD